MQEQLSRAGRPWDISEVRVRGRVVRFRGGAALCALCVASWISPAVPAEIQHTAIEKNGSHYSAIVEAHIDAPLSRVFAVLTDYDAFERIHDSIIESRRLGQTPDGRERVYIEARFCLLLMCFGLEQTSQFWSPGAGAVRAEVEPAASDFRYGDFRWYLSEETKGRTRLDFSGEVEPTAWIPPIIGPWYLKKKLPGMADRIASKVESLARIAHQDGGASQ